MLVTIAAPSGSCSCVPSLSSASTTKCSPRSHDAPLPTPCTSPPMMKLGCSCASRITDINIDEVVVLPCVPATPTESFWRQIAANIWALVRTAIPILSASTNSMLVTGIAVDAVTASHWRTTPTSCPMLITTPIARSRSIVSDSLMSLPETSWPISTSTWAMALIPGPPTPTT